MITNFSSTLLPESRVFYRVLICLHKLTLMDWVDKYPLPANIVETHTTTIESHDSYSVSHQAVHRVGPVEHNMMMKV
jgi:hypothetical protein